jgi:hypothetical protein
MHDQVGVVGVYSVGADGVALVPGRREQNLRGVAVEAGEDAALAGDE